MPAKLPTTSAKIDSLCEAKMPVGAGIEAQEAEHRPEELAAEHIEHQDDGDEGEATTATQHSTLVPDCQHRAPQQQAARCAPSRHVASR